MRALWVAALLLAGCAGDGGKEAEPEAFQGLAASADTGVIRGVVVDQSIQPVVGATVKANPGELTTISDASGAFGFSDLDPGVYFLTVGAPFYTTIQTSTEVQAGVDKPAVVRVALEALPRPVPAIQPIEWRFFMDGSAWVAGVGGVVLGNFIGQGTFTKTLDIAANATWIQSELTWDAAQPLASDMLMQTRLYEPGSNSAFVDRSASGVSPVIHAWSDPEQTQQADRIGYTLFVRDGTYPAGVTVSQDVYLFVHVFQHFVPDEGWQFGRDGTHAVPPPP